MVTVRFSDHLRRFVDLPDQFESDADSIRGVITQLESSFPGVASLLLHENGSLRQHVNVFLDNSMIRDRKDLGDRLENVTEVAIMQALSGG